MNGEQKLCLRFKCGLPLAPKLLAKRRVAPPPPPRHFSRLVPPGVIGVVDNYSI